MSDPYCEPDDQGHIECPSCREFYKAFAVEQRPIVAYTETGGLALLMILLGGLAIFTMLAVVIWIAIA